MCKTCSFDMQSDGSLVLTLDGICIQSAAKRAHREITNFLLDSNTGQDTPLHTLVDLLREFLSSSDFSALRTHHPELTGGSRCCVRIFYLENGSVDWEVIDSR